MDFRYLACNFPVMLSHIALFAFRWSHLLYVCGILLLVAAALIPSLRAYYKRQAIKEADKALFEDNDPS